jgi:PHP family Zn ribbon phosphoesterase
MSKAFQEKCSNNGYGSWFTCPGCYQDLDYREWKDKTGDCPKCGRTIHCHVEEEPVSVCDLIEEDGS